MAIHEWPEEHRPREKLIQQGAASLSDAELLAILLRTGTKGRSALDMAKHLLSHFKGIGELARTPRNLFVDQPGLGPSKFAEWQACLELGRRVLKAPLPNRNLLTESALTQNYLIATLRARNEECFVALFLNQANQLVHDEIMFTGTVNETAVHPRSVVKRALELNATGVIVAHNHPSGTLRASIADLEMTDRLNKALATVDIRLLDHIIVAGPRCLSLRETTGLFKPTAR
jgi:DNA repair protein RadC